MGQVSGTLVYIGIGIGSWLFASLLASAAKRMRAGVWISAGLLILAGLLVSTPSILSAFHHDALLSPEPGLGLVALLLIPAALVVSGMLLSSAIRLHMPLREAPTPDDRGAHAPPFHVSRNSAICLGLAGLLLAKTFHSLYWVMVWDSTHDPLGYLWLLLPIVAAVFSGVMLSISLPGGRKPAAIYSILVLALLIAVSWRAQAVDFRELTGAHALQTVQAIQSYYAREGRYPADLDELTPWHSVTLAGPMIIYGQGWCYDGGDGHFRLGYIYREHWSDPRLVGRLFAAEGAASDPATLCESEIAVLRARYPDAFSDEILADFSN